MRLLIRLVLIAWLACWSAPAAAQAPVRVSGADEAVPLLPMTYLIVDETLDPTTAAARLTAGKGTVAERVFSHGYTASTMWARIEIDVDAEAAGRWYLALELPNFDHLEVYPSWLPTKGGRPALTLGDRALGDRALGDLAVGDPPIRSRYHLREVTLPPGHHTLLVRGRTSSTMTLPLRLWQPEALHEAEQSFLVVQGFYLGIAILLAGAASILSIYLKQAIFLVFAGNVTSHAMLWLIINGVGPGYLWPGLARSGEIPSHGFVALAIASIAAFTALFLAGERVPRVLERIMWAMVAAALALSAAVFLTPSAYSVYPNGAVGLLMLPTATVLVGGTLLALFRGARPARLLMLAWSGLVVGAVVATLRDLGMVPSNALTLSGPQLGSTFEMLVFAVMLAGRLGRLHREKEQLQALALAASREQEARLEKRVAERTAALDAANRRLAAIVEAAPFPLMLEREADDLILFMNRRAAQLFAVPERPEFAQTMPVRLVRPDERQAILDELARDGITADREVELRRNDGSRFWVLHSAVRIEYDGQPVRLAAFNDISSMKALEGYLRGAAAQERDARRIQRQFVEMVSHEFRTPLSVIDAAAQNLAVGDPRDHGRIQKIRGAVQRLSSMIRECLVEDRGASGRIELNPDIMDLGEVLKDVVGAARGSAPAHGFKLEMAPDQTTLFGDRRLIEIAVGNLLGNATKYSPAGTTIRITLRRDPDGFEIAVADRGNGVPPAERDLIFEKYYRSSNTGRTAGAGLGLHLVRMIAAAHGGDTVCHAREGGGSIFVLTLPAAAAMPAMPGELEAAEG